MKVIATRNFTDLKEEAKRKKGDEFEVTQARFKEINSTDHGVLVEEVKEDPPAGDNGGEDATPNQNKQNAKSQKPSSKK